MIDLELKEFLESQGYKELRKVPGKGICGIMSFMFTVGLCYGLTKFDYQGRYCYPNAYEALMSLKVWDGDGDPGGDWIKHKGYAGEWSKI